MESNNVWSSFIRGSGSVLSVLASLCAGGALLIYCASYFKDDRSVAFVLKVNAILITTFTAGLLLFVGLVLVYGLNWRLAELDKVISWPKKLAYLFGVLVLAEFVLSHFLPGSAIEMNGDEFYAVGRFSKQLVSVQEAIALSWNRARFFSALAGLALSLFSFLSFEISRKF